MGEVYSLVNMAKGKLPQSKVVLSGVLQWTDVAWQRIRELNDKYDWIAKTLVVTFVDPNTLLGDWDHARGRLYINQRGAR
jgi:hypothetical protein